MGSTRVGREAAYATPRPPPRVGQGGGRGQDGAELKQGSPSPRVIPEGVGRVSHPPPAEGAAE